MEVGPLPELSNNMNFAISRKDICTWNIQLADCPETLPIDFSIQLISSDGKISEALTASELITLKNFSNRDLEFNLTGNIFAKPLIFETLTLPLKAMADKIGTVDQFKFPIENLKTVRFTFDRSSGGSVFIDKTYWVDLKQVSYPETQTAMRFAGDNKQPELRERKRPTISYEIFKEFKKTQMPR